MLSDLEKGFEGREICVNCVKLRKFDEKFIILGFGSFRGFERVKFGWFSQLEIGFPDN
jgi:hypothetical protein